MRIKELAQRTDLSGNSIRHSESIGLLAPPRRLANGYRDYHESDIKRVRVMIRAYYLDFSLDDIDEILALCDWC